MSTLVYVFINNNFQATSDSFKSDYSYSEIPQFCFDTLNFNSKKFNKTYIVTQKEEIQKFQNRVSENVEFIDVEEKICKSEEFIEAQNVINTLWARNKKDTFWYTTFIRVLLLSLFVKIYKTTSNIHVEADNIIFENDFTNINNLFETGEFGYCNEAPNSSAPSLIYLKDSISGSNLFNLHLKLLKKGDIPLQPYVGHFANNITDMAFLDLIYRAGKFYKMLPCVPCGPFSQNFDKLQTVFDPTSYGQFLGGTNNGHPPGYCEMRHYVGREIISKNIEVFFNKTPYIVYQNKQIPIFNLHVHNKKSIPSFLNG